MPVVPPARNIPRPMTLVRSICPILSALLKSVDATCWHTFGESASCVSVFSHQLKSARLTSVDGWDKLVLECLIIR